MSGVGDVIVIGPECFSDAEETVICWKGRNYYLPPDDGPRPRPERVVKAEALREYRNVLMEARLNPGSQVTREMEFMADLLAERADRIEGKA